MKRITLLLALAICIEQSILAQTNVSGYILSNTTWTLANSPYIVTGNALVNNGVTLTIEPGVTVKFDTTKSLQVDGELIAVGNAQNRITFTATDATPARGSWGRIQFSPNSTDAVFDTAGNYVSGSILKYCDIRYGGGVPGDVTVYCDTAAPYFSNCRISDCLKHALYFVNAVGKVDSSSIRNCGGSALSYVNPLSASLIAKNDTIENNGGGIGRSGTSFFSSIIVQDCIFTNSGNAVSNLASSTTTAIQNNAFTSNSTAVNVSSLTSSFISNNTFTANSNALQGALGANATISNNVFTSNTNSVLGESDCYEEQQPFGGSDDYNSSTLGARNLTISNNHFENNKGGIIAGGERSSDNVFANFTTIENNTFLNNQFVPVIYNCGHYPTSYLYRMIEVLGGKGLIANNVFDGNHNSTGNLIRVRGVWEIASNLFKNNSPGNIYCSGEPTICHNKFVSNSGNVFFSDGSSSGAFIHDNEFNNNVLGGQTLLISNKAVINNNLFLGNTRSNYSFLELTGGISIVSNNRFWSNSNSGNPIISISNSNSKFQNNDFQNNSGLSCVRISGTAQPVVTQNNFVNPGVQYEIENQIPFGPGANINFSDNYWGTTNTTHIDSVIKDYFDDANLSVALYSPVLSSPALVDTNASCTSVVCSLSVSGTVVNVSCFGGSNGSINITVANGTSPYTYVWSSGASTEDISSRTSGSYTVTVIDANFCSATKSYSLSQPASVAVVSGVIANASCNTGGSINIAASGGISPYTYNWGSGITTEDRTGLNPGNYTVTVNDNNNCTVAQSFTAGQSHLNFKNLEKILPVPSCFESFIADAEFYGGLLFQQVQSYFPDDCHVLVCIAHSDSGVVF